MNITPLHPWSVSATEARSIQDRLRERVRLEDTISLDAIQVVAGADNGYTGRAAEAMAHAAVVTVDFRSLQPLETVYASVPVTFPYVPGLLSFREAPALVDAFARIRPVPDVVLFDGQGYAHPRRLGLASHLGLILGVPTIGCAKTKLIGTFTEPPDVFGAYSDLVDRGEVVGAAVRTKVGHSPLFVSPGNALTVQTAVQIVLACCQGDHFLPEPTRLAHNLVTAYRNDYKIKAGNR